MLLRAQSSTTDLFDNWGQQFISVYEENDMLTAGRLNQTDHNFSQGIRVELMGRIKSSDNDPNYASKTWLPIMTSGQESGFVKSGFDEVSQTVTFIFDHENSNFNKEVTGIKSLVKYRNKETGDVTFDVLYADGGQDKSAIQLINTGNGYIGLIWIDHEYLAGYKLLINNCTEQIVESLVSKQSIGKKELKGLLLNNRTAPITRHASYSGADYEALTGAFEKRKSDDQSIQVWRGVSISHSIYTPSQLIMTGDLASIKAKLGDKYRPYAGHLQVGYLAHSRNVGTGGFLFTEAKLGVIGPMSLAREAQGALHLLQGYTDNPAFDHQLTPFPITLHLNTLYRHDFVNNFQSFRFSGLAGLELGTLHNYALLGFNARATVLNTSWFGLFVYNRTHGQFVASNGLLAPTIFNNDGAKLLAPERLNRFFLQNEVGLAVRIRKLSLNYAVITRTAEFVGQDPSYWGRVMVRYDF